MILAAGESRRMGTQKLLLPFGETTIVGAVAGTAASSRAGRTLVVLGADHEAIRRELEPLAGSGPADGPRAGKKPGASLSFAINTDYRLGMLTSIQAGFRALPPDAEAALIMLGDQPFLSARVVDAVVAAYETGGRGIVIPTFKGRRGHPVLIDLEYRNEILRLDPSAGLRGLMRAHPGDILDVDVADPNILRDLDTPEDYAGLPKPS
jgi:molybdenum cofactor cytidylyltransferase